jgi:hypothetical protein
MNRSLQGRLAPSLLRGCFLCDRNVLRIVSIGFASLAIADKEAAPQGLNSFHPWHSHQ